MLLMGGTFDPVHYGHLRSALELKQALGASEIRFIPCGQPVHKDVAVASGQQRLDMLALAIDSLPGFRVDDYEICQATASYTVETLNALRKELGSDVSLVWAMGTDAFKSFTQWHQWQEILALAHLAVIARPGEPDTVLSAPLTDLVADYSKASDLQCSIAGKICFLHLTPLSISSTQIRNSIKLGHSVNFLLPDKVLSYINQHRLYG